MEELNKILSQFLTFGYFWVNFVIRVLCGSTFLRITIFGDSKFFWGGDQSFKVVNIVRDTFFGVSQIILSETNIHKSIFHCVDL